MSRVQAIMAVDQGTTNSRAIIFGRDGAVLGVGQRELPQHYPEPGWVEHDPEDIWGGQLASCRHALRSAGLEAADLAAIGISNQRETALLWDAETGLSLGNAIVWQCRRTAARCAELEEEGHGPKVERITGLRLDPYFSATKLEWLLAARPEAAGLARTGRLRAGTIDSFLVWRFTKGRKHLTDYSNASRTLLLDLARLEWSEEMLDLFGIPATCLPRLCPSSRIVGATDPGWLGAPVPIAGIAGDQQAALFGQGAFERGDSKNTYGTGCFLLANTGPHPVAAPHRLLSTVAWVLAPTGADERTVRYALEGSVFTAGAAVQWLRDGLGLFANAHEIGPLAASVPDSGGVLFVPALTGLGAPYWDPAARGMLIGLTRGTIRAHIARAAEEAICLQVAAVLEAITAAGLEITALRVDGGAAHDDFLLQLQADVTGIPVARCRVQETTALGAAALAGLAVGFWSEAEVRDLAGTDKVFHPRTTAEERARLRAGWERAVERASGWATGVQPPA
jgi:glycerol kinase